MSILADLQSKQKDLEFELTNLENRIYSACINTGSLTLSIFEAARDVGIELSDPLVESIKNIRRDIKDLKIKSADLVSYYQAVSSPFASKEKLKEKCEEVLALLRKIQVWSDAEPNERMTLENTVGILSRWFGL